MDTKIEPQPNPIALDPITPGRHIDQLILQTRSHHMHLSSMADIKANIMLTLSALIVTFSIGYLDNPLLRWPVVIMICFCVITILASAYAVMPKYSRHAQSDLNKSHENILFFGTFSHIEYEAYLETMEHIMRNPDHVYEAQIREIYELGTYLGHKKYRYIQLAYQSFLLGLIASVVAFVVVILTNSV